MIPGWFHDEEAEAITRNAAGCPGPWVEIGSYCGLSTSHLGRQAETDGVTLFAVDPHKGNPEMAQGNACHHPEVWAREHGSLSVLIDTVSTIPAVVPVVGTSLQFAQTGCRPGFVFIDASHAYPDVRDDFDTWGALLAPGGLLALHDADLDHWGPGLVAVEAQREGWRVVEAVKSLVVLKPPLYPEMSDTQSLPRSKP